MIITAPTRHDLNEIAKLLEDFGILTSLQASKFDDINPPKHITIVQYSKKTRAKELLKEYLPKGNYGFTGYSIS
ncbi:MAG TPA: hypothetical protein VEP90_28365 [Methylomirabilota bacterium]|nr:hypothetical protein [Methylomirabilota bacterium]